MDNSQFKEINELVSSRISELLMLHDCVVIPGFGALIGNYLPSRLHPVTHLLQAPGKQLVFNRSLKTDDGLLTNAIGSSINISFSEARVLLSEYVSYFENRLYSEEKIYLKGVGEFRQDVEQNIVFNPSYDINFLPESFGLPTLQIQLISRDPLPERRVKLEFENRTVTAPTKKRALLKAFAKTIPVVLIAAFFAVNAFLPETKQVHVSDFSFFNSTSKNSTAMRAKSVSSTPLVRKFIEPISSEHNFSAENAKVYLVAGCYSNESNASGMVEYLNDKGFDSKILDKTPGGLFRVVYGNYEDITSASSELSQIKKGFNEQAWMLIK